MPKPTDINPKTGKRYNWVDPRQQEKELSQIHQEIALLERAQAALQARDKLLSFTKFTMPDPQAPGDLTKSAYKDARFHQLIAGVFDQFYSGQLLLDSGEVCVQLIFVMPPRHGKSIAHDQPILTPDGWRKHGELQIGDQVFGPDGKPTQVVGLSADVDEVVPVTFSNGEVIRCHLNHEWTVYDRSRSAWRTLETRDIAARTLRNGPEGRSGRWTLQLPDTPCVDFPRRELLLDPYVLGAWLGDGHHRQPVIAHSPADTEVIDAIAQRGHEPSRRYVQKSTGVAYAGFVKLTPILKTLGVFGNKHVPEEYLRSSYEQRLQLLAGLVDTDGHVEQETGRVRFSTCCPRLRDGVYDLATTLGFRPYIVEVQPSLSSSGIQGKQVVFQVGFQPTVRLPTRIPRKHIRKIAARRRIGIVSVGQIEKSGARSICVDRADGLYLVGEQCVVTHNTELATKRAAAKYSGNHPDHNIAVASYSDTMAEDMGADTRAIMATPAYKQVFPSHKLRRGGTAKANIQTDKGGRLVFVGRGGALTGRGAHLMLIDDLFKDHEEARSQTVRDQAWNWFTKVAMTRRMGRKLVVITMTRWHSDDIIGRLTDPENPHFNAIEAKKWKIIRLPAIAEEDDPLGRKEGEPLWPDGPDKFDLDFLQSQQRLDPLGFASLYQQRPTVADGILFQRETIQYYKPGELPEDLRIYCASDHAVGLKQRNDPTVLLRVGVDKQHNIYILDCFWKRAKTDAVVEAMLAMASGNMRPLMWWAEKGHISQSIGPFLHKQMEATQTYFTIKEVTPVADKEQRAQSIAAMVSLGKVYFPKDALWTEKAVNEMLAFPNGTHDDFVDALAYIGLGLRSQHAPIPAKQPEKEPKFGTLAWVKHADNWKKLQDKQAQAGGF